LSQYYASSHLDVIDERFYLDSVTQDIINNSDVRVEFNGKNSVTIYTVDVVDEVDYVRDGENRFGALVELGTGEQTFTLSQDKSFTFTVDRGNLEDSMMVQEANKAVKRQVREVSIPNTDVYRLSVLAAYAVANSQAATSALASTDAYQKFLTQVAALVDAEVGREDIVCYLSATNYNLLKRDPEFSKDCDLSYADAKTGTLGKIDGVTLKEVPSSYLPANTGYLMVSRKVLVSPTKFNMIRVLTDQRGIDGAVAEGRRYYDAFIPANKGVAIRLHKTA
jgi:hypothetical protein